MVKRLWLAAVLVALAGCSGQQSAGGEARAQILAVGSSTVYPFTRAVAEEFQRKHPQFRRPVLQSTGTGAGFDLFCAGVGGQHPDIGNASRRIRMAELNTCRANGVTRPIELQIGIDGVAFAQSPAGPVVNLTKKDFYEALAATPYGQPNAKRTWKEINAALPDIPILVYGPPASSGTRDALAELIMIPGCETNPEMRALRAADERRFTQVCTAIRTDGPFYVDSGEDDQRITQQVIVNPGAVGVFGYSFLKDNVDKLRGLTINGIAPSEETITSGRYPGARPLFIYVKGDNLETVPGLKEFLAEYAGALGPDSYLARRGLIPAPEATRARTAQLAAAQTPLNPATLEQ